MSGVTQDNKKTWQQAELTKDGTFSYSFPPETGRTYEIYVEITDTRGKTNEVDDTRKEVTVSDSDIMSVIRDAVDAMINAYKNEDAMAFMSYVSDDFAGDYTILDRAIRSDFSIFDNIDLRYTLNTVTADSKGMIFVSLTFNRFVISSKTGHTFSDRGSTEFVFQLGQIHPMAYSMKNPLIFGLSDASEVATGSVISNNNDPVIVVDERGNIVERDYDDAIDDINQGDDIDENVESGNGITIFAAGHPPVGFDFAAGEVTEFDGDFIITGGDESYGYGFLGTGVLIRDLGNISLNDVSQAPETGYSDGMGGAVELYEGHVYAFQFSGSRYGLLYVSSVSADFSGGTATMTLRIDYKYRSDGSPVFLPAAS